ncbi:MAG: hypothetical protein IJQ85_02435 [Selenomonadaceae bacterium]|nr:hypothetical protein [Selenomonadaceae bacterium]
MHKLLPEESPVPKIFTTDIGAVIARPSISSLATTDSRFTTCSLTTTNTTRLTGGNDNHSRNCGWEGDYDLPANIKYLRHKMIKNAAAILLTSIGIPMILAGDEFGNIISVLARVKQVLIFFAKKIPAGKAGVFCCRNFLSSIFNHIFQSLK